MALESKIYGSVECPFCVERAFTVELSRYIEEEFTGYHFRIRRVYKCISCQASFEFDTIEKELDYNKVIERDDKWLEKLKSVKNS